MKKVSVVAVAVLIGAGIAYASSIAVPWFIDDPGLTNAGYPPNDSVMTLITLNNTTDEVIEFEIEYFNAGGERLGPDHPLNTFVINPKASIAFRPCVIDPSPGVSGVALDGTAFEGTPGGQEGLPAAMVPIRPQTDAQEGVFTGNGSATITWVGAPEDVQGMLVTAGARGWSGWVDGISYAHLLGK